jgi:hypothetical protein
MAYTTINKPSEYFNTKLYTGNSTITNAITGVGFQPDWVWLKGRNYSDSQDYMMLLEVQLIILYKVMQQ